DDFCMPAISYANGVIRGPGPAPVVPDPAFDIDPNIPGPDQIGSVSWCRWTAMMNSGTPLNPMPPGDGEIHLDATTGLGYHPTAPGIPVGSSSNTSRSASARAIRIPHRSSRS